MTLFGKLQNRLDSQRFLSQNFFFETMFDGSFCVRLFEVSQSVLVCAIMSIYFVLCVCIFSF